MSMVIALLVLVAGSVLFHFVSPWWLTPLASNWQTLDDTLTITIVITGLFFVAINLFMAWTLWRYRHRPGQPRAAFEPDNKVLERRLIVGTSVGIVALLAPGLWVYADYVHAPSEAMQLEVLGRQWQWFYRFPGADGRFGKTDVSLVSAANPFGIDPADPAGHDNVLILGSDVHLPLNRPVKVLLRSDDVLHDFFVPPFRARMNVVPGMVTTFWFTPTKVGRYEVMCAQLCGVGHFNMRSHVVVEDEATFRAWLQAQPTFAMSRAAAGAGSPSEGATR